jgi:hypothetical protein
VAVIACGGGGGSAPEAQAPADPPVASTPFGGSLLLGAPTTNAVRLSLLSSDQTGTATVAYGTASGTYERRSAGVAVVPGEPATVILEALAADTTHFYRVEFRAAGSTAAAISPEYRFHTARPAGTSFTFTVQADSHLDENSSLDVYRRTLANVTADASDFHVDLGDTFMTEKHSAPFSATSLPAHDAATVNARYAYERSNFGIATA